MPFTWFSSAKPSPTTLGYKVTTSDGINTEFETIKGTIQKTSKKYREEITKYKEIAKLNEKISTGYLKNLDAMIDVSRILNYYVEIFNILKVELEQNERVIGETSLKVEDIGYLERLTRNKVDELSNKFMTETEQLKKLYTAYGKTQELGKVIDAQETFHAASAATTDTVNKIKAIQEQGVVPPPSGMTGGKKKKGLVRKTKASHSDTSKPSTKKIKKNKLKLK